jgi:hypothetical protein
MDELVGVAETAKRLGLTSERVRQLARASQMPPPAGKLGRQDVWRWRDIASWAAATGRLDPAQAKGRQAVRAWLPGQVRRRKVLDAVEPWGPSRRGRLHVRIWQPVERPEEPAVVLLGNLEDEPLGSVTNRFQEAAMEIAVRHLGQRAIEAQFYDHWSGGVEPVPTFHQVVFTVRRPGRSLGALAGPRDEAARQARAVGGVLSQPEWREATRQEIEGLVGEPVQVWAAGTYTSELVRAAAASPDRRIGAVWDPGRARDAEQAIRLAAEQPPSPVVGATVAAALARHALDAAAAAAERVASQPADAPVWLVAPELSDPASLRARAGAAPLDNAGVLWQAITWVRTRLRDIDPEQRRMLVPAVAEGWARLHWTEAHVPEPVDPRDGAVGPMLLPADILDASSEARLPTAAESLRTAELALLRLLDSQFPDTVAWDAPRLRPAGPYSEAGPVAQQYLSQVRWHTDASPADEQALVRLAATLGQGTDTRTGRDRAGNLVMRDERRRRFAVEWPAGAGALPPLHQATVQADPSRQQGAQPVFVRTSDGSLLPLPARPGWRPSHQYLWGYPGEGPRNLAEALADLLAAAGGRADAAFAEAAATVSWQHVQQAEPAWSVDDLVEQAETRAGRPRRRRAAAAKARP